MKNLNFLEYKIILVKYKSLNKIETNLRNGKYFYDYRQTSHLMYLLYKF